MTRPRDTGPRDTGPRDEASRDDERMEAYRAGAMSAAERLAFEDEILASDERAEELYADLAAEAAIDEAARAAAPGAVVVPLARPRRAGRWLAVALPLAAAVAFLVLWSPRGEDRRPADAPVFRGDATALAPLEPVGDLAAAPTAFAWSPRADARAYRLEVSDADGSPVWRVRTVEPRADVPAGALAALDARGGLWKVLALDEHGLVLSESSPVRFRVRPDGAR